MYNVGDISREQRNVEQAAERYEAGQAELLTEDGQRKYADQEHDRRAGQLRSDYEGVLSSAETMASNIGKHLDNLPDPVSADPTTWLSSSQLATANSRAAFIREDVELLRPQELEARIRNAMEAKDTPALWLYARYLGQQREAFKNRREGARTDLGSLAQLLAEVQESLVPESARKAKQNHKAMRDAHFDLVRAITGRKFHLSGRKVYQARL